MDNLNQPPAGPPGQQPKPAGIKWTTLLWLLLAILIVSWLLPSFLGLGGSSNETVTYSTFVAQASANNAESVQQREANSAILAATTRQGNV